MKKVLQIVDSMHQGGIQAFIMNVYRNINRKDIQFDFLVFRLDKQLYEEEILSLGGSIFKCPGRREGIIKNKKALDSFFSNHKEYTVVHYHASSLSFIDPLVYARKNGIEKRIIHCHSSSFIGNPIHIVLHNINKQRIGRIATDFYSCSAPATKWMFGGTKVEKQVVKIVNGINVSKFKFNDKERTKIRKELHSNDKDLIVGHIGRFSAVKNHKFLVDIFIELKLLNQNAKLCLVGDGELFDEIKSYVNEKQIEESVIFLGNRTDIPELLSAFDLLVLPSQYEGFPVTAVEAQAAGLPVYYASTITNEVMINRNVCAINLSESAKQWAETIINTNAQRIYTQDDILDAGFDINTTISYLESVYTQ